MISLSGSSSDHSHRPNLKEDQELFSKRSTLQVIEDVDAEKLERVELNMDDEVHQARTVQKLASQHLKKIIRDNNNDIAFDLHRESNQTSSRRRPPNLQKLDI